MPIAAAQSTFESLLKVALNMGPGAQIPSVASAVASAIAAGAPMGLYPVGPVTVPLAPAGLPAGQSLISSALSLGPGAQIPAVAAQLASAFSVIAPLCPPVGLPLLQTQIQSALSLGPGATQDTVAQLIAVALVQFYTMGGTL